MVLPNKERRVSCAVVGTCCAERLSELLYAVCQLLSDPSSYTSTEYEQMHNWN